MAPKQSTSTCFSSQSETKFTSSVCSKRKKTTLPTIVDGNEDSETAMQVNAHLKKTKASHVKPELRLFSEDPEMPPGFLRNGVPEAGLPSSLEEEKANCDLRYVLEEKMLPEDRQHLVNAASVLKSQLVARLTSDDADKLSTEDKITLANRCCYALRELGDDYKSFKSEVNKLIEQHDELKSLARKKRNWNDQYQFLNIYMLSRAKAKVSFVTMKLSSAEVKLFDAKTNVDSIKLKREELTGALLKLNKELNEGEERVKILTAECDQCKEDQSVAKAQVTKLEEEKEKARQESKVITDQYNASKKEGERLHNQLLQLARK